MSIINNQSIKRNDTLTATGLNAPFTAVNNAFPLDGINFSAESVDLPALDTLTASGQSGLVLVKMDSWTNGSSTTAYANTGTSYPFTAPDVIISETFSDIAQTDDILRVYWNVLLSLTYNANTAPIGGASKADDVGLAWAIWLQWDITGGGTWENVPNQGSMITSLGGGIYGATQSNMQGCSLQSHVYIHRHSGSDQVDGYESHNCTGDWYYKIPSQTNIYGLRLVVLGLFKPGYPPSSGGTTTENSMILTYAPVGNTDHSLSAIKTELGYLRMRSQ